MILSRESIQRMITDMVGGGGGAGISSSALANLLTGYATQDWVGENYISIEFFSRLFQAHGTENGQQTDIAPNDMDSTITSIESLFGFWTDLYISALGNGGSIGSSIYLSTLADVQLSSPSTGQVLTYNATTGQWVNANPQGGVTDLANLTDVTLTSLQTNQILIYDATSQKWVNSSVKTINGYSIFGTGDIPASGGGGGNYLPLAGGTMTGSLQIYSTGSAWNEGLRMHVAQNGWCGVVMCGSDNTGNTGTSPLTWSLHNNDGAFYLVKNGSNTFTHGLSWNNNGSLTFKALNVDVYTTIGNVINIYSEAAYAAVTYYAKNTRTWVAGSSYSDGFYFWNALNNTVFKISEAAAVNIIQGGSFSIGTVGGSGTNAHAGYISAGVGYSVNSGRYGLRILCCDQADTQTGLGQDLVAPTGYGNAYNFCVAGGNNDGDVGWISFVSHKVNSTSYRYLGGFYDNAGSVLFQVIGTIYATGAVTALSDARKKDVQKGVAIGVEQIADAPAVQFLWKGERAKEGLQVGTLAQYWQTVLPEVVMDKGGELSMQYGVAALVSAIITARKVVDHERRIQELEKENQDLRREISNIRVKTNIHMRGGIG